MLSVCLLPLSLHGPDSALVREYLILSVTCSLIEPETTERGRGCRTGSEAVGSPCPWKGHPSSLGSGGERSPRPPIAWGGWEVDFLENWKSSLHCLFGVVGAKCALSGNAFPFPPPSQHLILLSLPPPGSPLSLTDPALASHSLNLWSLHRHHHRI